MQPPRELILNSRSGYVRAGVVALILTGLYGGVMAFSLFSGARWSELLLPAAALAPFWIGIPGVLAAATYIGEVRERRAIRAVLEGEPLARWQYPPSEWQQIVEERLRLEEKSQGPMTFVASLAVMVVVFGTLFGLMFLGVGPFENMHPQVRSIMMWFGPALILFLTVFVGVRYALQGGQRQAKRERLLRVFSPVVTIGPTGIYHDADGYTSLASLAGVALQPGNPAQVVFTVMAHTRYGSFPIPISAPVPSGREADAEALVSRFAQPRPR